MNLRELARCSPVLWTPSTQGSRQRPSDLVLVPCEGEEGLSQVHLEAPASVSGAVTLRPWPWCQEL